VAGDGHGPTADDPVSRRHAVTLTYRPGSKQDPTYQHADGTYSVLVSDIMQQGTPPQVFRGLTDPAALRDWTGNDVEETRDGVRWRLPELGASGTTRLWPAPRATLVMVSHRGLTADDLDLSRGLWAPGLLNRLRFWVMAMAPRSRTVGVVDGSSRE
jgi:hypothetical protein